MAAGTNPVLEALGARETEDLLDAAARRAVRPGERLCSAGEPAHHVFLIRHGVVRLSVPSLDGDDSLVGLAARPEIVGDVALAGEEAHPFDAVAVTVAGVYVLHAGRLRARLEGHPGAALALARCCSTRALRFARIAQERSGPVRARVAGRLLDIADTAGRREGDSVVVEVPIPHRELAKLAGTCRESASRALGSMRRAGLIDYRRKQLRIHRRDLLERLRCEGRA